MPDTRHILILSLSRRAQPPARLPKERQLRVSRSRLALPRLSLPRLDLARLDLPKLYLPLLTRLLRLLGYRFSTVSQALQAPYGKFACLTFDSPEASITSAVVPQLSRRQVPATIFVTTAPTTDQPEWHELKLLKAAGWEIGTLGHELVNLTDKSLHEQQRLISQAKSGFITHLGFGSRLFAYPFGAYDATTVSCLREAGFSAALTLRAGVNRGDNELQRFHLKRLPLIGSPLRDLAAILRVCLTTKESSEQPAGLPGAAAHRDRITSSGAAL